MNAEVKAKWLAALRGELEESPGKPFEQGMRELSNGYTYCCLGVLCELYRRETGEGSWVDDSTRWFLDGGGRSSGASLPRGVVSWAGLGELDSDPEVATGRLSSLNDSGSTFVEIADLIEAQL